MISILFLEPTKDSTLLHEYSFSPSPSASRLMLDWWNAYKQLCSANNIITLASNSLLNITARIDETPIRNFITLMNCRCLKNFFSILASKTLSGWSQTLGSFPVCFCDFKIQIQVTWFIHWIPIYHRTRT